jgi:hypothetical protein
MGGKKGSCVQNTFCSLQYFAQSSMNAPNPIVAAATIDCPITLVCSSAAPDFLAAVAPLMVIGLELLMHEPLEEHEFVQPGTSL